MHAFSRIALGTLLLAGAAWPAWAQGNPSSDVIIQRLSPTKRGIRPTAPAPVEQPVAPAVSRPVAPQGSAPAAQAARPAPPPPVAATAAPSVNLTVQFATNSTTLTPAAMRTLDELGRALASPQLAAFRFRIEGHTDTVGSPEANKSLSERRASAVLDYLASKFSIDRGRIEAVGMGQDGLLVQTPAQTPEPRNRRVQVINLGA